MPMFWICFRILQDSLHIGHLEGYGDGHLFAFFADEGFNVLHPMGFDAFGLPGGKLCDCDWNASSRYYKKNIERF